MSPRLAHPKKHFAEIFADHFDCTLTSYARSGFSNGAIAIQIESAISNNPDLILLNLTNSDRIEFLSGKYDKNNTTVTMEHLGDCHINPKELSDNFYQYDENKTLVSENLYSLLHHTPTCDSYLDNIRKRYDQWDDKILAIKSYFTYLHHAKWKNQVDQLMMHTILYRLHKSNIPYILVHDFLGLTTNSRYYPDWLTQKHTTHDLVHSIRLTMGPPHDNDPGFHLTYEGSEAVANVLIEHYNRYF